MSMKLIITFFTTFIFIQSFGQLPLPIVGTTEDKSLNDLIKGISNEKWFFTKGEEFDYYIIYFKNTPVGLKHAFDKYYSLRSEYKTDDCTDNSVISTLALNSDKTYDYEMLSITIINESSEIVFRCKVKDNKIRSINLECSKSLSSLLILVRK